jgi:biopolymer transport protein ExbD
MKINLQTGRKARIEMLPLIDIVFLLLVFFIYAMLSMAVHRGLPVDLPTSKTAKLDKRLILSVTVKSGGSIFVDEKQVWAEELIDTLKARMVNQDEPGVLLFADRSIDYQTLYQVLDKIRLAGINRISLQADLEQKK